MTIKPGEDNSCKCEKKREDVEDIKEQNTHQNQVDDEEQKQAETQKEEAAREEQKQVESQEEVNLQEQTETQEIDKLNKLLEDKQKEIDVYKNRWLRAQADFENYKKRMQREIQEINLYAGELLVRDILPVIDNLERALDSVKDKNDAVYKGVQLIYQQLVDVLKKHEIREIEALGKPFDPNYHEAVMMVESEEFKPNTVAEVLLKGYMYHSKVIRPSMVKVAKN